MSATADIGYPRLRLASMGAVFSWWLGDGTGNWHVATAGEPSTLGDGTQAFRLRLTPPLAAVPDAAEIVVTGPVTRVRATVPVGPATGTSDD